MQQHTVVNGTDWAACYNSVTSNNNNQNEMQHRDFVECLPKKVQLLSALDGKNRILEQILHLFLSKFAFESEINEFFRNKIWK